MFAAYLIWLVNFIAIVIKIRVLAFVMLHLQYTIVQAYVLFPVNHFATSRLFDAVFIVLIRIAHQRKCSFHSIGLHILRFTTVMAAEGKGRTRGRDREISISMSRQ